MTATTIPTMIVEDVEPRTRPGPFRFMTDPMRCDHVWEPHLWDAGRAYCAHCGSFARWINDPRCSWAEEITL